MARKFNLAEAAFGQEAVSKLDTEKIRDIPLHQISGNAGNFYALENVEALAGSIQAVGLLDPVVVTPLDVGYKLISGHRRLEAFRLLAKDDPQYETIPARVLPSMDQLRETLALVTANATARELTYPEKLQQEKVLRETLADMKAAGMEVPRNLGAFMAEQLGTSRNEVSRMHQVNEKLVPEARELVDRGEMNARQAYDLSRKPETEQRDAIASKPKPKSNLDIQNEASPCNLDLALCDLGAWMIAEISPELKYAIQSRADGIATLRQKFRWTGHKGEKGYFLSGSYDNGRPCFTAPGHGDKPLFVAFSDLWDRLGILAMKAMLSPGKEPAADLWHAEPPEKTGDYVCFYRLPYATPPKTVSSGILTWDGEWKINGNPVAGVYEVQKWTEVPK